MSCFLGVDLGGSAVKLAAVDEQGRLLPGLLIRQAAREDLGGLLARMLKEHNLSLREIAGTAVTGVGAPEAVLPAAFSPQREEEFAATAAGALYLAGRQTGVVVSLGTGTALLYADGDAVRHLCGSGIGGGTLTGLCGSLCGTEDFGRIGVLAGQGRLNKVDLTVGALLTEIPPTLHPDMTVTNFGRVAADAVPADLAAGAVNLILQAVGTMALLACQGTNTDTAIFTGSVTELPQAEANFQLFSRVYGVQFLLPPHAAYATALGAARLLRQKKADG